MIWWISFLFLSHFFNHKENIDIKYIHIVFCICFMTIINEVRCFFISIHECTCKCCYITDCFFVFYTSTWRLKIDKSMLVFFRTCFCWQRSFCFATQFHKAASRVSVDISWWKMRSNFVVAWAWKLSLTTTWLWEQESISRWSSKPISMSWKQFSTVETTIRCWQRRNEEMQYWFKFTVEIDDIDTI